VLKIQLCNVQDVLLRPSWQQPPATPAAGSLCLQGMMACSCPLVESRTVMPGQNQAESKVGHILGHFKQGILDWVTTAHTWYPLLGIQCGAVFISPCNGMAHCTDASSSTTSSCRLLTSFRPGGNSSLASSYPVTYICSLHFKLPCLNYKTCPSSNQGLVPPWGAPSWVALLNQFHYNKWTGVPARSVQPAGLRLQPTTTLHSTAMHDGA